MRTILDRFGAQWHRDDLGVVTTVIDVPALRDLPIIARALPRNPRYGKTSHRRGRLMRPPLNKDTRLCISLAARPSNIGTRFHNYLYDLLGLDFIYKAFTTTDIVAAIGGVRALGIRGCSVSMPFKQDVIALVDQVEDSARAINAVNTIVNDDGHLTASNTDYIAVQRLIDEHGLDRFAVGADSRQRRNGQRRRCGVPGQRVSQRHRRRPQHRDGRDAWRSSSATSTPPRWDRDTAGRHRQRDTDRDGRRTRGARARSTRSTIAKADTVFDVVALPSETPLITAAREARASRSSPAER